MVSADLVKQLREKTGAGMMSCKEALAQSNGDFDEAIKWLRTKGILSAGKKSDRATKEGVVGAMSSGGHAVVIEINSETDFVARNEKFLDAANAVLKCACDRKSDSLEALESVAIGSASVKDSIIELVAQMGENIVLRRIASLSVSPGIVASYVHSAVNAANPNLGRIAVLVALESAVESEADHAELLAIGREIAMHVAANRPQYVRQSDVPSDIIAKESAIIKEQSSGKPDNIIEKMIDGRIRKFLEEIVLEEQAFVKDPSIQVKKMVEDASSRLGKPVQIASIVRFSLGEDLS